MFFHTGILHRMLFPSLIWKMSGQEVYLTFDDGPHPVATPIILQILREERIRATFFLSGNSVSACPQLVNSIHNDGHSIGIHAYHHERSLAFSRARTIAEIRETESLIKKQIDYRTCLYRPPFGLFTWNTLQAAKSIQYRLVMWTTLTGDFLILPEKTIVKNALHKLDHGSILVFHDNEKTASKIGPILSETIKQIKARGFAFGTIV